MITVSVPGKVILMGEHAVVYGKPALAAAINLRLSVSIEENTTGLKIISTEPTAYVLYAVEFLTKTYKLPSVPFVTITIASDIPAGFHLGSSAAIAVAVTAAFTYFVKKIWNPAAINQLAYEIEKKQHGFPSGVDNTTVTMGGVIWFRRELDFLKSIWQLPFKPAPSLRHFFLIDTGRPVETTGEMVAWVKDRVQQNKTHMDQIFAENEHQTKRVTEALKTGDEAQLIDAIQKGERTLEGMGVVSKKVIPLVRSIEKIGGAAKILGGGGLKDGVGFLLCYHSNPDLVQDVCASYNFSLKPIVLGEEGIQLESKT
jgi:mevalonate kinase